jgi:hypothetical protein
MWGRLHPLRRRKIRVKSYYNTRVTSIHYYLNNKKKMNQQSTKWQKNHPLGLRKINLKSQRKHYQKYLMREKIHHHRPLIMFLKGNRCEDCGATKKLHLHHINYDWTKCEDIYAEILANLWRFKLWCLKCHYKYHTIQKRKKVKGWKQ